MDTSKFTLGIDTSYWELGKTNWKGAKADGIMFGVARACNGRVPDKVYNMDVMNMKANQVIAGDYLEFDPSVDPIAQAHVYADLSLPNKLDFLPCIAFEKANFPAGVSYSESFLKSVSLACVTEVEKLFNKPVCIYTGYFDWRDIWGSPSWSKDRYLWLAQYRNYSPDVPSPWTKWTFWQFTDQYAWSTGHADGNYYNGTMSNLISWLGSFSSVPPVPPSFEQRLAALEADMKTVKVKLGL